MKWIYEAMEPNTDLYFQPSPPFSTPALKTTSSENEISLLAVQWEQTVLELF